MKTEEAQQIYAQRSRVAEFVHAWIKERCGLRQFRCRGRLKATMEVVIIKNPNILGGTPVFRGTRVPVQTLFDYLEGEKPSKNF